MRSYIVAVLALATAAPLMAQAPAKLTVAGTSKITILGTSNLHNWECSTSRFQTTIEVPAGTKEIGKAVTAVVAEVPVKQIDCEHRGMAGNLQKAMNADQNPTVRYRMTGYQATPENGAFAATLKGFLTINGVEKPVDLTATVTPDGKGSVTAVSSIVIHTPDFNVQPVSAMFGRIKTGETVTIKLEISASEATIVALGNN